MNFNDMIKKSVIDGFSYADLTTTEIIITLVITFAIALYIFQVYKLVTKSAFYFKSFNVSMAIISVVTAGIILAMQSSIVISLDPMDLLFLFWSIGTGIICGAGLYKVAVILAVMVTVGILILDMLPVRISPWLLIINADSGKREDEVIAVLEEEKSRFRLKSKNLTPNGMDLILEVKAREENKLVDRLSGLPGIVSVSLLAHDGDVKG